jgi:hypothetical protein
MTSCIYDTLNLWFRDLRSISFEGMLTLLLISFITLITSSSKSNQQYLEHDLLHNSSCAKHFSKKNRHFLDVFWINIDRSIDRKHYMSNILNFYGLPNHRISAITPENLYFPRKELEKASSCISLTENETIAEITKFQDLQERHRNSLALNLSIPTENIPLSLSRNRTMMIASHCGKPKNNNNFKIMCNTLSHLLSIYFAVFHHSHSSSSHSSHSSSSHSTSSSTSLNNKKYALLLEDDIRPAFEIDFEKLIAGAPEDFVMLQLVTSNEVAIEVAWDRYMKQGIQWNPRGEYDSTWATCAFLIHKERLKSAIEKIIMKVNDHLFIARFEAVDKKCPQRHCCSQKGQLPQSPCIVAPYGYEADGFLYNMVYGKTYLSSIPLFLTSEVAEISTLHQEHLTTHSSAFTLIKNLLSYMLFTEPKLIPSYANFQCVKECHPLGIWCAKNFTTINSHSDSSNVEKTTSTS